MDKEDAVHIYSGILLSHRKECSWVTCRDVYGPRVFRTERCKSERYYLVMHICGIYKMVQVNTFAGQEQRRRHRERMCGRGEGRRAG